MTDDATRAHRLLASLRERPHSVDSARTEARRERIVPRLEQHLTLLGVRRRRMQRLRYVALSLAAAVVALAVVHFGTQWRAPLHQAASIRAVEGRLLHRVSGQDHTVLAGDRLTVPVAGELFTDGASGASLETESGLRLDLEANSEVSLSGMADPGTDRRVELLGGQLACSVPKLEPGSTFSVVTPNTRVVVHGTKFSVRVDSSEAGVTRTCVRVREGLVAVHHAAGRAMLHAGEAWGCPEDGAKVSLRADAPPKAIASPRLRRVVRVSEPLQNRVPREGTLARETALLQSALAAERGGRRDAALSTLTELLSNYPESPLLPEARETLRRVAGSASQTP